jgi:uncharacterized protein (TIGR00266 family)
MKHSIEFGPVFSILKIQMEAGEVIKAESGAMVSMSTGIELKATTTGKGFFGAIGAMVGGENLFASEFTANQAGEVVLAPSAPGDIVHIPISGGTIFAQAGSYLAGSQGLTITAQGSFRAMFSGEGLFLSKISGTGDLFVSSFGAVYQKTLGSGELYRVDTGHIVAFDESVTYKIKKASKGLFSTLASGEGLVGEYLGPGRIWIQTRNVRALAQLLIPFLPSGK